MFRHKRLAIYLVILLFFLAELVLFAKIRVSNVRPELLLVATLFFGLHFGVTRGLEVGVISGLLKDATSITHFGVNTLLFILIGVFSGYLKKKLFKENFVTVFFLSFLLVYFASGAYFLYLRESGGLLMTDHLWKPTLFKGLYTGVLAPPLFFLLTAIFGEKHEG